MDFTILVVALIGALGGIIGAIIGTISGSFLTPKKEYYHRKQSLIDQKALDKRIEFYSKSWALIYKHHYYTWTMMRKMKKLCNLKSSKLKDEELIKIIFHGMDLEDYIKEYKKKMTKIDNTFESNEYIEGMFFCDSKIFSKFPKIFNSMEKVGAVVPISSEIVEEPLEFKEIENKYLKESHRLTRRADKLINLMKKDLGLASVDFKSLQMD